MTIETEPEGEDELSFSLAAELLAGARDLPAHTQLQWPSLKDDSQEPPTDAVVLTDALLAAVEASPKLEMTQPLLREHLPASIPEASPPALGPTTKEAFQAIRPSRWVAVSAVALVGVALFGGLLLRASRGAIAGERQTTLKPVTRPPPVEPPVEATFAPFPAEVVAPSGVPPTVTPVSPRSPASKPASKRRPTRAEATEVDALEAWQ
jgi:hypothetical protein